jgi:hypothetical protein
MNMDMDMDIESLIFEFQKKQRIIHMDLDSGNIMLEERKHSIDEMNAKIAATRKEKVEIDERNCMKQSMINSKMK